jgi:hypothetical protein
VNFFKGTGCWRATTDVPTYLRIVGKTIELLDKALELERENVLSEKNSFSER